MLRSAPDHTAETATAVQSAAQDRRLGKAHVTVKMGGVVAAIQTGTIDLAKALADR